MKCDQVRDVLGLYLDSELDGRNAQEVQAHLEQCRECANLCRSQQTFEEALRSRLRPSAPTPSLWEAEEAFVTRIFQGRARGQSLPASRQAAPARRGSFWREFFWPAPSYYAGLAVVWLLLLVLRPGLPEPAAQPTLARSRMSAQARFALVEQRRELKKLLASPEPAAEEPQEKVGPPRSERPVLKREA